jgi:hypothetical protein
MVSDLLNNFESIEHGDRYGVVDRLLPTHSAASYAEYNFAGTLIITI